MNLSFSELDSRQSHCNKQKTRCFCLQRVFLVFVFFLFLLNAFVFA